MGKATVRGDLLKIMDIKAIQKSLGDIKDFLSGEEIVQTLKPIALEEVKKRVSEYAPGRVNNIKASGRKRSVRIYATDPVLIFNEYGTGTVGKTSPHPEASSIGWIYDVNGHGTMGWWYPTDSEDHNPIKKTFNNQLYAHTKGLPARMGFYRTKLNLGPIATDAVKFKINGLLQSESGGVNKKW